MPARGRPNLSGGFVLRIDMASMQRETMAQRMTWGCIVLFMRICVRDDMGVQV